MLKKYTDEIIATLDRDLSEDQKNRIRAVAEKSFDSVKPETKLLFHRIGAITDKYLSIPENVSIESGTSDEPNTEDANLKENVVRERLTELDSVYMQQQIMLEALNKENEHYDEVLLPQAEVDMQLCNVFEQHLANNNANMDEQVLASAMSLLGEENTKQRTERMRRSRSLH